MTQTQLFSSKTYTHSVGLSCCFRQWRADSHCRFLHGYALQVKIIFGCTKTDKNGWVQDFGSLKPVKQWLEETFDHKTLVAKDDPLLSFLMTLSRDGSSKLLQLVVVPAVGCEAFAKQIFDCVQGFCKTEGDRVYVQEVEVREHEGNSAICRRV